MDDPSSVLVESLLTSGRTLALQLNERLSVRVVHNAPLLVDWRGREDAMPGSLQQLLEELLPLSGARSVMDQIASTAAGADQSGIALGTFALRAPHGGGPDRHVTLSLHRDPDTAESPLLLVLRDVTALEGLHHALAQSRESLDAAMAVVRASPQAMRMFLSAGVASVGALRATMKLPARDQETVHTKLSRLQEAADQLGNEARTVGLATVTEACAAFAQRVAVLRERPHLTGDDLLPLAPLVDDIATAVGNASRIEEVRHVPQSRTRTAARSGTAPDARKEAADWARGAERSWSSFVRRRSGELGTLVKLQVQNALLVPPGLRRDVDDMLQHLLRNAVEHGIETPELRLAAQKPASGLITVKFEDKGRSGVTMTVRDDGQGFDVERIGQAAVRSGLVAEESLLEYDPGEVVGLIFKPTFSTEHLDGEAGRGRGMSFLRRAVTRIGGQITVATKPGSYTRFVIHLPAQADATSGRTAGPNPA